MPPNHTSTDLASSPRKRELSGVGPKHPGRRLSDANREDAAFESNVAVWRFTLLVDVSQSRTCGPVGRYT